MKNYKYIRIILILIPIITLFYLINKQFPLNGKLKITYDFKRENAFIGSLNPKGRLSNIKNEKGDYFQIMLSDPVYFDLELPTNYSKAIIELKYKSEKQEIIEIGGLVSKDVWNFQTKPIQNLIIDELSQNWHKIEENETILLQKEKKYSSIDSFLQDLPNINEIAVFNYNLPYEYVPPDYKKSDEYLEITHKLRGKHSFYTYLGDGEDMDFIFELFDLNQHQGSDLGQIEVFRGTELVKKQIISDDGIVDGNKQRTDLGKVKINFSEKQGVYKVNLLLTDDILINKIKTKQNLIAFTDKLDFYRENEEKPINIFSNSSVIKTATNHTSGFQILKIDGQDLEIKELNIEYIKEVEQREGGYTIEIPNGNVLISGDALFSFDQKYFFDPRLKVLNRRENLIGANYVVTNYTPPKELNGWKVGIADLDLPLLHKENNKVKLMISAPNLDRNKGKVTITDIKIFLEKRPIILKIFDRLFR